MARLAMEVVGVSCLERIYQDMVTQPPPPFYFLFFYHLPNYMSNPALGGFKLKIKLSKV